MHIPIEKKRKICVPVIGRYDHAADAPSYSGGKSTGRPGLLNFQVCLLSAAVNYTDDSSDHAGALI